MKTLLAGLLAWAFVVGVGGYWFMDFMAPKESVSMRGIMDQDWPMSDSVEPEPRPKPEWAR